MKEQPILFKDMTPRPGHLKIGGRALIKSHASPFFRGRECEVWEIRGRDALVALSVGRMFYRFWMERNGLVAL